MRAKEAHVYNPFLFLGLSPVVAGFGQLCFQESKANAKPQGMYIHAMTATVQVLPAYLNNCA